MKINTQNVVNQFKTVGRAALDEATKTGDYIFEKASNVVKNDTFTKVVGDTKKTFGKTNVTKSTILGGAIYGAGVVLAFKCLKNIKNFLTRNKEQQ